MLTEAKTLEISQYINDVKKSNIEFNIKIENVKLRNIVEILEQENSKIPKIKGLLEEYKKALEQKDNEINNLYKYIEKIPRFLRKWFIKNEDIKFLDVNIK